MPAISRFPVAILAPALAALLLALPLADASAQGTPAQGTTAQSDAWRVVSIEEEAITEADDVTLNFADGMISGRACNRFFGRVALIASEPGAGEIFIGRLGATMMHCEGRVGELERVLHGALEQVHSYRIEADGTLVFFAGETEVIRAVRL